MKRRIPFGRIVAGLIAAALCVVGVGSCLSQAKLSREHRRASSTDIFSAPIDLSTPGTHTAKFDGTGNQAHGMAHGQALYLQITPQGADTALPPLGTVEATVTITDADGKEIAEYDIGAALASDDMPDRLAGANKPGGTREVVLTAHSTGWGAPPRGSHALHIDVKRGAPELKGADQRIVVRDSFCGLENILVHFYQLISIVSFVLAAIIAAVIIAITRKRKRDALRAAPVSRPGVPYN